LDPEPEKPPAELTALGRAIEQALRLRDAEERFLLASYYLDGRTLLEIGRALQVHEATVSRRLRRLIDGLRKQILRNLQSSGMSRRAAQEALGADPRDLELDLRKMLQNSPLDAFQEKAAR
jgi:RNA polymerase sigma-70 factor (ECF subfamily)